jgi:hypothetical protein
MKPLRLLFIVLLSFMEGRAQKEGYTIVSLNVGNLFPRSAGHDVTSFFPYTSTSVLDGKETHELFNSSTRGRFRSPSYLIDLSVEYDKGHHGGTFGIGGFTGRGGDYGLSLKAGYRYIVPLGGLQLKPAIDVYYLIGANNNLGNIDNREKMLSLPGLTSYDQFTVKSTDEDGGSQQDTYYTDHLDVNYRRNSWLVKPGIILSAQPRNKLVFSLEAGWMFQVAQSSFLQFVQKGDGQGESRVLGKAPMEKNGKLSGPYAAISIGISLPDRKRAVPEN